VIGAVFGGTFLAAVGLDWFSPLRSARSRLRSVAFRVSAFPRVVEGFGYNPRRPILGELAIAADVVSDRAKAGVQIAATNVMKSTLV
jgi:hypothetical protein